jgi:hypothetical protein
MIGCAAVAAARGSGSRPASGVTLTCQLVANGSHGDIAQVGELMPRERQLDDGVRMALRWPAPASPTKRATFGNGNIRCAWVIENRKNCSEYLRSSESDSH